MSLLVGSGRFAATDSYEPFGGPDLTTIRLVNGGLAVSWNDGGAIVAYVIDANGNGSIYKALDYNVKFSGDFYDISLAALPNGGFAAAWIDLNGNINTRAFDAALNPTGVTQTISSGGVPGSIGQPSLSTLQSGDFVMAYFASDSSGEGIRAQIYSPTGSLVGSNFAVNTATIGNQELPVALGLSNGGFLVSWADDGGHVYAGQFYNAAGEAVGGQVTLAPGGNNVYDIITLASGDIVIVWPSVDGEIKGQIYTVAGVKVGAEFQINAATAGIDLTPDITALDGGGFAVAWSSPTSNGGSQIRAQAFSANGSPTGVEILVSEDVGVGSAFPRITGFGTGDLTVSWIQADLSDGTITIMTRFLYSAVQGTGGADLIAGTSDRDFFFGMAGDDQLSGGDANDELHGDDGNDILNGGAGLDQLDGGAGNDVLDTGTGSAISPYDGDIAWGGSGADQITGGDGWDRLYSDQRDDYNRYLFNPNFPEFYRGPTLDHGSEVDVIFAGGGDDLVSVGYGDSADGGTQTPNNSGDRLIVSFFAAPTGVTADFRNATVTVGGGTITGFEQIDYVEGSQFNDVFTFSEFQFGGRSASEISTLGGDDQVIAGYQTQNVWLGDGNDFLDGSTASRLSYVSGGNGNDTIIGRSTATYSATLDGGDGDDVIQGGGAGDVLIAGAGNDTLDGGGGTDTADFGSAANGVNVALAISSAQDTNQGIDTFVNIENLRGSAFDDTLGGTAGSNDIRGGAGNDWLYGGAGGNDQIFGDDGNDTLDGRGGAAAQLYGGNGNDTYYVDGDDTINEFIYSYPGNILATGVDQVYASVTYTLGAGIENLTLTGSAAINGTGTPASNIIVGNVAANVLNGSFGNDTLTGGLGVDTLTGGAQLDTFRDTAAGLDGDTITDFARGDRILITDAAAGQTLGWSNGQLTYGSASITLSNLNNASITTVAAPQGGVQIVYGGPALVVAGGSSAPPAQQADGGKAEISAAYAYPLDHPAAAEQALIPWAESYQLYDFL